jgi:hypothetical protein
VPGEEREDEVLMFECVLRRGSSYGQAQQLLHLDERSLFLSAPHPQPVLGAAASAPPAALASPSHAVVVVQ